MDLFLDAAGGETLTKTYLDLGLKIGPIILPLYQSWDSQPFVKDWDWMKARLRFELSMPTFYFGG